ncbi:hypothetical protein V499_03241 [Pseudogymnoascus sp. VKM F-103]|nr:hypothetical protein V499_03241 [Pseudogymnoascus sp. VKM F-103]
MVSSVLGKRTRSSVEAALPATLPRPKRQAATVIYSDENDDPFAPRQTRAKARSVSSDVSLKSSPGKHNGAATRAVLQPTQIKKHFNTVKSVEADENAKIIQVKTPQTPRHRDALSKQVPTTPRHRVTVTGTAGTPRTPRTPSTPSGSSSTIYNVARQLFTRSSDPGRLIGREEERLELSSFINTSISTTTGGCTYVSGPPGTGKSAMVNEVVAETPANEVVKKAYVNCMSMKSSKDLYCVLLESLCGPIEVIEGEELQTLQGMFAPRKPTNAMYLITLDEIDHVVTLDLECMYKLFEWALQPSSHLILVGIANALDLTDRFLPRLKARNLKPNLLPFLPYTAAQIKSIITTRLKSLIPAGSATPDFIPFLHPAAIELCSRKVSAQTGDLRKAFDICRRAVDLIETETKAKHQASLVPIPDSPSKKILAENPNLSSPVAMPSPAKSPRHLSSLIADSLAKLTVETAPRASIAHLNKVTAAAFSNGVSTRLKTLNLQQKAALCALVALERRKRAAAANIMATPSKLANAAPTIKQLYDTYCHLCCADSVLQPLTSTEFRDVVGSLETLSLVSGVDGRTGSFVMANTPTKRGRKVGFGGGVGSGDEKRVGSCVGEQEIERAVEGGVGAVILKSILSGESLAWCD